MKILQTFKLRNDIKSWWEDENKNGGEIQFDIPKQFINIYDNLYQVILYEVIGQSNEHLKHVFKRSYVGKWEQELNYGQILIQRISMI
ncbi:unnamed protein product [Paramecium octaurelia]|uniref:Uncharacterized protein n=1 Tax=Paramecium octaurelia TaxID=43137 RepID=A0A8S1X155_PAROT|nr:unnamed protein product [Paramecium octaurelia]